MRGTKSASHHNPSKAERVKGALDNVLHIFKREKLKSEDWFIDVAMEIRHEGHVLQWLTKGHHRILEFLLPSASQEKIAAVLKSQTQYQCDLSAQLADLGGFRAAPGSRGRADKVVYINVYTTDKSVTYQLHKGIFKRRKAWHLFPGAISQLAKDLEHILDIFLRSGGNSEMGGVEGNARMEIRVPLDLVDRVLLSVPDSLIQCSVTSFECRTFW